MKSSISKAETKIEKETKSEKWQLQEKLEKYQFYIISI